MIENNLLPDFVLNLEDGHAPPDYLLRRILKFHGFQSENLTKGENDEVREWYNCISYYIARVYDIWNEFINFVDHKFFLENFRLQMRLMLTSGPGPTKQLEGFKLGTFDRHVLFASKSSCSCHVFASTRGEVISY